jgi:hypothetical protein
MRMTLELQVEGDDDDQMDAFMGDFIRVWQDAARANDDVEILELTARNAKIQALLSNLPVQMGLEDAEQLRGLIRQMAEHSPGPATLALEIIDAAILLR